MKDLFERVVENALDFLHRSVEDFEENPKYSVISFDTAVELLVKSRLMAEHWSLIVCRRQVPDRQKFASGDFQSVSLEEAANKLEKTLGVGLKTEEIEAFRSVRKQRNKMVHFFHKAYSTTESQELLQDIARKQLKAWYLLHHLLRDCWSDIFDGWSDRIAEVDKKLRRNKEFLEVVFRNIREEIRRREKSGSIFRVCPSCDFPAQEHQPLEGTINTARCLVCELNSAYLRISCPDCESSVEFADEGFSTCQECGRGFEPEILANILISQGHANYATKGPEGFGDLANCGECDSHHTVILTRKNELLCACCFGTFESLRVCGWCGEPNTGDMELSYLSGCGSCEGKLGFEGEEWR